jgi:hypothetical protein
MYWLLVITLIQTTNPHERPAVIRVEFPTESACTTAADNTDYWSKNKKYLVTTECVSRTRT